MITDNYRSSPVTTWARMSSACGNNSEYELSDDDKRRGYDRPRTSFSSCHRGSIEPRLDCEFRSTHVVSSSRSWFSLLMEVSSYSQFAHAILFMFLMRASSPCITGLSPKSTLPLLTTVTSGGGGGGGGGGGSGTVCMPLGASSKGLLKRPPFRMVYRRGRSERCLFLAAVEMHRARSHCRRGHMTKSSYYSVLTVP